MERINDPVVEEELRAVHEAYEKAFVDNDIETLTNLFWDSPMALRFGVRECLYGAREIEAFRKARPPIGLNRDIFNIRIVTFGSESGVVTLEFRNNVAGQQHHGRQTQVWQKFSAEWKIVSAHVSFIYESYVEQAAALVGLTVPVDRRIAVEQQVARAGQIASVLFKFPLSPTNESAPRFEP